MRFRLGLSSGSCPELGARALTETVRDAGGDVVDLRAGKGHAWEREGVTAFASAGVDIAFVGVSVTLGDAVAEDELRRRVAPFAGFPLKVFARGGCTTSLQAATRKQMAILAEIAGDPSKVLVETHHGYATVDELRALHASEGVGVLLDTMGLCRLEAKPFDALRALAQLVVAVQVKGFALDESGESQHLPLAACDARPTLAMLDAVSPYARVITVETRAGSAVRDLAWLQHNLVDQGMNHATRDHR